MDKNIGKKVLFIYAGMYLGLIVIQVALYAFTTIDFDNELVEVRVSSIMNLSFYGLMVVIYLVVFKGFWKKVLLQFKQNKKLYLKYIGLGLAALLIVSAIVSGAYQLAGIDDTSDNQAALDALLAGGWFDQLSLVLFAVFFAPLVEEMVFRMAIFDLLKRKEGIKAWVLIAISSFLFGLIHVIGTFDFIQIFYYAGLGVVLGYFYYKSKNIAVPIVIHMLLNGLVTILMFTT